MKASELIKELEALIESHGDREVRYVSEYGGEYGMATVDEVEPRRPRSIGDVESFLLS